MGIYIHKKTYYTQNTHAEPVTPSIGGDTTNKLCERKEAGPRPQQRQDVKTARKEPSHSRPRLQCHNTFEQSTDLSVYFVHEKIKKCVEKSEWSGYGPRLPRSMVLQRGAPLQGQWAVHGSL